MIIAISTSMWQCAGRIAGSEATPLLPPPQSVELARRALDLLPSGGTPLAAALPRALNVAKQTRER
jgi:magnesium chelatase subunit D